MDEVHAGLHEGLARHLGTLGGWTWRPEVSFSIYGERGIIDILAWHAESRSLLIIELKTAIVDPQGIVESPKPPSATPPAPARPCQAPHPGTRIRSAARAARRPAPAPLRR